jgi:hypothetical protein
MLLKVAPLTENIRQSRIVAEGEEVEVLRRDVGAVRPAKSPRFRIDRASGKEFGIAQRLENGTGKYPVQIRNSSATIAERQLKLTVGEITRRCDVDDHRVVIYSNGGIGRGGFALRHASHAKRNSSRCSRCHSSTWLSERGGNLPSTTPESISTVISYSPYRA